MSAIGGCCESSPAYRLSLGVDSQTANCGTMRDYRLIGLSEATTEASPLVGGVVHRHLTLRNR